MSKLQLTGMMVGRIELTNFEFDPGFPYTYCRICGDIFQSQTDRRVPAGHLPENSLVAKLAQNLRNEWAIAHARTHPDHVHNALRESGLTLTPEAAQRLAPFGIVPITDMVMDAEVREALATAPRAPTNDAVS
jgi:hypothetical protein